MLLINCLLNSPVYIAISEVLIWPAIIIERTALEVIFNLIERKPSLIFKHFIRVRE